jgi:hypothetical protein
MFGVRAATDQYVAVASHTEEQHSQVRVTPCHNNKWTLLLTQSQQQVDTAPHTFDHTLNGLILASPHLTVTFCCVQLQQWHTLNDHSALGHRTLIAQTSIPPAHARSLQPVPPQPPPAQTPVLTSEIWICRVPSPLLKLFINHREFQVSGHLYTPYRKASKQNSHASLAPVQCFWC